MKKLVALISTEGKSLKQLSKKLREAFQKYFRVRRKVEKADDLKVDLNSRNSALQKGTLYSFIPKHLESMGKRKFNNFPFNVMFASFTIRDGNQVMGSALYKPDFRTYLKVDEKSSMEYRNVYGGDSKLLITYDGSTRSWVGRKFVKGESIGIASGPSWKSFFVHFTALGVTSGENCEFSEAMSQETVRDKVMRISSELGVEIEDTTRPGVVTQIVGYPKPKPQEMNLSSDQLEELVSKANQRLRDKGLEVGEQEPEGTMQVIFRPTKPQQPSQEPPNPQAERKINKKSKRIKRFFDNVFNIKTYQVSLRPKNEKSS